MTPRRHATPDVRAAARARVASHYRDPVAGACATCIAVVELTNGRRRTCRWRRELRT